MLKGNLSTRPFYNERAVTAAIGLVALVTVLLTLFNAAELTRLSGELRRLQASIDRDQAEAQQIERTAATGLRTAETGGLPELAAATRYANDLIEQRTFSWTTFFALIERTLPPDVRLVSVSPRVEQGAFRVTLSITARRLADVGAFVAALRDTTAFHDVAAVDQQANDDETYGATVDAVYRQSAAADRPGQVGP